jgi:Spy/CpxP family protein refolding chaperone
MGSRKRTSFRTTRVRVRGSVGRERWVAGALLTAGMTLAAAAALALASGGGSAWAQTGSFDPCQPRQGILTPEDRESMRAMVFERLKERIGLTDAQADDIRATLGAQRDARRQGVLELCQAGVDLRRLLAAPDTDPALVRVAGERLKAARARMLDRRLETYLELRSKLTADQWDRWIEARKHMGRRGHRWHRPLAM